MWKFSLRPPLEHRRQLRREQHDVRAYIPHMTPQERQIIAYLLAKNLKMFPADIDGEYAASLISKKIVVYALDHGEASAHGMVPFEVPEHVWKVLVAERAEFPYQPPPAGEAERQPWRIPRELR
jgi:hypothetical protein